MTEKRFKIVDEQFISYYGGTGHKISNEECGFWLWHNKIESQKICDKLNNILDENEQLKQSYIQLKHRHSLLHDVCIDAECDRDSCQKDVSSLEKENEQLKQQNSRLMMEVAEYSRKIRELKGDDLND